MMKRVLPFTLLLFIGLFMASCDVEPDTFNAIGDASYFAPAGTDPIQFQVDSIIFDPSVGGTARIESRSTWTLEPAPETDENKLFFATIQGSDSNSVATQRFVWDFQTAGIDNGRHTHQLNGFSYVSLVTPFTMQSSWDALQNEDPSLVVTVAGEPLEIHKDWTSATIDSIGPYSLPDGSSVDAVFVSLSQSENFVNLREFKEVYGKGLGLLERSQRFLDTQQTASREPWEDKAENGFTVQMKRIF